MPVGSTGAHNVFHISRLKKAADKSKARELETPKWMRQGFPNKITDEDRDYEVTRIMGHHDPTPRMLVVGETGV